MPLSRYAMDRFIAPGISKFTVAHLRDMADVEAKQASYTADYILNTIFHGRFDGPVHHQMFNFLRRSHAALQAYSAARTSTLRFLADADNGMQYVDAVGHWETFIGCAWQAFRHLSRGKPILYYPGDGSWAERLNLLHNAAKHADERIEAGGYITGDAPLTLWLTNDGLRNIEFVLSFAELEGIAEALHEWSEAARDPATMEQKLRARRLASESDDNEAASELVSSADQDD